MHSPVITGYYRYTDIWFEWHKVLPVEDGAHIKAILAHNSLVHPDHPLHIEGVNGVQLYMGTLATGESRLLVSSKQVDYVRYWLYAMRLTKTIIPLPYSDCLMIESDLLAVSPAVYPDGFALKNAIKVIEKNNRRFKRSNPVLTDTHRQDAFERVRTYWVAKKGVWCALDFEAWEQDRTLTEFGWSLVIWKADGTKTEEQGHLIVEEAKGYVNSQYVVDQRYKYYFGESNTLNRKDFKEKVQHLLSRIKQYGPVFLTFHDYSQDIKYLKGLEVELEGLVYSLPDTLPDSGTFVIDTSDLIGALLGEGAGSKRSLEKTCNLLQIPTQYLHNAGNDAHYTLLAMQSMAGGDPVDVQREKRWPKQTVLRGQVSDEDNFKPMDKETSIEAAAILEAIEAKKPVTA